MANNVGVSTGTGATIAAEDIGGVEYQRVKLVGGAVSDTTAIGAGGTVVVAVTGTVPVTGNVAVTGPVSISGVTPVTTAASVSVAGVPVWLNPTQQVAVSGLAGHSITGSVNVVSTVLVSGLVTVNTIAAGFSVNALVTGPVSISAMPGVSIVGIAPVTTAVSVSVSGFPVWLNPTQPVVVNTIAAGFSVNALVTGPVSISAMPVVSMTGALVSVVSTLLGTVQISGAVSVSALPAVSISVSAVLGTVGTLLGTVLVSQANIAPVTTAASVSVSGWPVWLNPTQQVVVSGLAGHSITGSVNVVSTVLVSGLVAVNTIAAGFSVNALVTGPVSISAMPGVSIVNVVPVTTAASVSVTALPVWLNPTQQVVVSGFAAYSTVGISGGSVSVANAVSISAIVPVTTAASVSVTGWPVWLNPTQGVNVSTVGTLLGTVNVNVVAGGAAPGTTAGTQSNISGQVVWLAPTQTMAVVSTVGTLLGTVAVTDALAAYTSATIAVTSSAIGQVVIVKGLQTGTVNAIPADRTTAQPSVSATGAVVWVANPQTITVTVSALAGSVTVIPIYATTAQPSTSATGEVVWLAGGTNVDVTTASPGATATGEVVWVAGQTNVDVTTAAPAATATALAVREAAPLIVSVLPVTTQASVSVSGVPVWWNPTAVIAVSGGALQGGVVTGTQVATSGQVVWLAPTQTVGVVSTIVTILGTQIVSVVPGVSVIALASMSSLPGVTTGLVSGNTGLPVWPGQPVNTPFLMMVTSTAIAQSATAYLFTVWTGTTVATAGVSLYVAPAGKNLCIQNIYAAYASSAVLAGTIQFNLVQGAAASFVSASYATQGIAALLQGVAPTASTTTAMIVGMGAHVPAAGSVGLIIKASTAAVLNNLVIQGYLF